LANQRLVDVVSKETGEWVTTTQEVVSLLREHIGRASFRKYFYTERSDDGTELDKPRAIVEFLKEELEDTDIAVPRLNGSLSRPSVQIRPNVTYNYQVKKVKGPGFWNTFLTVLGLAAGAAIGKRWLSSP
jgi:hypothetical protein